MRSDRQLHLSIETAEALRDLAGWGDIDARLTTANLGILDLLADLDLPQSLVQIGNPTIDAILSRFLIDARTAGLEAVGFMYQDYVNVREYKQWLEHLRALGYRSAACMGPKQVAIAHSVFALPSEEIERAQAVCDRFEQHRARGIHGFLDPTYGFVDEPIYRDALNTLRHHKENL